MRTGRIGVILLAIWLILTGVSAFINLGDLQILLSVLAIISGFLLFLSRF